MTPIRFRSALRPAAPPQLPSRRRDEPCSSGIRNECNLPQANPDERPAATDRPPGDCGRSMSAPTAQAGQARLVPTQESERLRPVGRPDPRPPRRRSSHPAVGTSPARPAFGTNAICRRQIRFRDSGPPRQIALRAIVPLRRSGRQSAVPTQEINRYPQTERLR